MVPCPHSVTDRMLLFPARDYITGDRFEIVHCRACGLNLTQPQPTAEQWPAYYPEEYFGAAKTNRFPAMVEWWQRRLYARRARRIEKLAGGIPGRVLDIGCGRG